VTRIDKNNLLNNSIFNNKIFQFIFDFVFPFSKFLRKVEKRKFQFSLLDLILHVIPLTFFIYWLVGFLPSGTLIYFIVFTYIASEIHIHSLNIQSQKGKLEIILWYYIVVSGFINIWNFTGHFFLSDYVANFIGWQTGSPFQIELAFFHLATGIACFCAIWFKNDLKYGIAAIKIIFPLGANFVHLNSIIKYNNYNPGNAGTIFVSNIVIPLIYIYLLISIYRKNKVAES
jgi:hypothetical protein